MVQFIFNQITSDQAKKAVELAVKCSAEQLNILCILVLKSILEYSIPVITVVTSNSGEA